mmetsp:Transcript_714/g.1324  ORF Transcript_714/g.1324 Transcript_714/m.1324 type:complete len:213 (-) Transcript_714:955-1593(-)
MDIPPLPACVVGSSPGIQLMRGGLIRVPCAHLVQYESFLFGVVRVRCEFYHSVQRNSCFRGVFSRQPHKVGVDHAQNRLVGDDDDRVLMSLHVQHNLLDALDDVEIRLPPWVSIRQLVLLTHSIGLRALLGYFLVGHTVKHASEEFVQSPPLALSHGHPAISLNRVLDELSRFVCPSQSGRVKSSVGRVLTLILFLVFTPPAGEHMVFDEES